MTAALPPEAFEGDPNQSGVAGALSGLAAGFQGGFGFRTAINTRKRQSQIESDLMTLRQQANARENQRAADEQTDFDEQQSAYRRAQALRSEIATQLSGGGPKVGSVASYVSGTAQPAPASSPDAVLARGVGNTLGQLGNRDLTDDQALLVGSGQVPASAIQPKTYHPKTRQEWLDNIRIATGIRGKAQALPITLDHAFTTLDRIYTHQDPNTGGWVSGLSPGDRLKYAKKLVAGTLQPKDLPDIEDQPTAAPAAAPADGGGLWGGVKKFLGIGGSPAVAAPDSTPGASITAGHGIVPRRAAARGAYPVPAPDAGGDGGDDRIQHARDLIGQYRDLPPDQVQSVLRQMNYSDDEIRDILGGTNP